jgi:hypothetical protein
VQFVKPRPVSHNPLPTSLSIILQLIIYQTCRNSNQFPREVNFAKNKLKNFPFGDSHPSLQSRTSIINSTEANIFIFASTARNEEGTLGFNSFPRQYRLRFVCFSSSL